MLLEIGLGRLTMWLKNFCLLVSSSKYRGSSVYDDLDLRRFVITSITISHLFIKEIVFHQSNICHLNNNRNELASGADEEHHIAWLGYMMAMCAFTSCQR